MKTEIGELLVMTNETVGRQLSLFGSYEKDETHFFQENIKPNDICLDIGGNIGYFALLFARCAPQGKIHVFEPIELNVQLIKINAALNDIKNVVVNKSAVGASVGNISFSVSKDSAFSSIKDTGRRPEAQLIEVPITTIDAYVSLYELPRVDILKVDVEGAEGLIIQGAADLLADRDKRPRIILLELFEENLKVFDTSISTVLQCMDKLGYKPSTITEGGKYLTDYQIDKSKRLYNVIFTPFIK